MAWLDDRIRDHPKIRKASPAAFKHWALALCYCSAHGTEGQLDDAIVNLAVPKRYVDELVKIGLWDVEDDGSLWVHDWQEHNEKRDQAIEERRKQARERQRRHRERVRSSRVTPRDDSVTVTRDTEGGSPQPVTRDVPRGGAPTRARDHDQEEEPTAAAPVTPPQLDAAAAADLGHRLRELGVAIDDPDDLPRAGAWHQLALLEARTNPAGFIVAGLRSGEWPSSRSRAQAPPAPALNGSGRGYAYIRGLIDNGVLSQMFELDEELAHASVSAGECESLRGRVREQFTHLDGWRLPADELEHQLEAMGAGEDELVGLLEWAADRRSADG